MICRVRQLWKSRRGASRPVVIALIVLFILGAIAAVPIVMNLQAQAAEKACALAMDNARRRLKTDFMMNLAGATPTAQDARDVVAYAMHGWDNVCPSGGTVYVVENTAPDDAPYDIFCGLHDPDIKRRTRLNASYVLAQIRDALAVASRNNQALPESVTVTLHGVELTAVLVDKDQELRHGTDRISDLEGIVIYYAVVGRGDFQTDSRLSEGEVCYFGYADENYCANWTTKKSWTGDSYQ